MQVLSKADVVLYDGLVNEELLRSTPKDCVKQCVGKRGQGGDWSQSQIGDVLVGYAKSHRNVVRLKGGDTGVFARTAEEIDRLTSEGIPYEVVPGLTVALAVAAYTGIPITHRDWSSSVALVTAHGQASDGYPDSEEPMDWEALARFPGTLVLYMGVSSASQWSARLVAAGKPKTTPVALVRRCTWPDQQVLECDLASVVETLETHPEFQPPCIGIVGAVVRATPRSHWFASLPLRGKRFVITSPAEHAHELCQMLEAQGAQCLLAPAMVIEPPADWDSVDATIAQLGTTDWLVFSSGHGVRAFFGRLEHLGKDARSLAATGVAAVGTSTAQALRPFGIRCDLVPEDGAGAESLLTILEPKGIGKQIALVRAPEGSSLLLDRLRPIAARITTCDAYRQVAVPAWPDSITQELSANAWSIIATSSNGARQAFRLLGDRAVGTHWLSISPAVTDVLNRLGCHNVSTSDQPNYDRLVQAAMEPSPGPPGQRDPNASQST
jgi:uroporphyrinogen III methyltransferase/synthase